MGTSFLLLLVLVASILLSKYTSDKINPQYIPPSEEEKNEFARKAKAAAVAVAYVTVSRYESQTDSDT